MRSTVFGSLVIVTAVLSIISVAAAQDDFQKGEQILAANQAPADAPLRRHPKALWYTLSNLRKDAGLSPFGEISIDFRRDEGQGGHDVILVVKGASGRREYRSIGPSPFADKQGTVSGRSGFGPFDGRLGDNLEVWLEQNQQLAGKSVRMKISKSITLGSVGQLTFARHWSADEQKAFQDWEKSTTPPPAPPAGYQLVATDTPLLPGMPVLAGWMAAWQPGEIIDVRKDGSLLIKYKDATPHLTIRQRDWVAIEPRIIEAGKFDPKRFEASIKVLPNGLMPIPADLLPVAADTQIVKGTPLKAEWGGKWSDVTVLDIKKDGKLRIHWEGWASNWDEDRERSTLMIAAETLAELKKPGAAEKFASRAEKIKDSPGIATPRNLRDYPISIAIPKSAVRVTDKTPLEEGTKLGCSWGNSWHDVTVLEVNDDETVKIHWDKFGNAWDSDISRECLIIDKKVLAKLEAAAKKTAVAKPATKDPSDDDKPAGTDGGDFKVVLKSFGTAKIPVTKVVMEATGLDLKDAKEFVESVPVTIKQNLSKPAAEKLRKALQDAGGQVAIELQ